MTANASNDIEVTLRAIGDVVLNATTSFEVWRELQNADRRQDYEPVVDEYPIFFESVAIGMLIAMTTLIYSVQESRRDSHNLPSLLRQLRALRPNDERVQKLEESIASLTDIWTKVSRIRNKVFGHRVVGESASELFASINLRPDEIRDLLSSYKTTINQVAAILGTDPPALLLSATPDTQQVMQILASRSAA